MVLAERGALTIRRARRNDVPVIVAMIAEDPTAAAREEVDNPLPRRYFDAFEAIDADPDQLLVLGDVDGEAERLPFADGAFAAAYATWAYFFTGDDGHDPSPGLAEVERVVAAGGLVAVADNLGGDEFTALSPRRISADPAWWAERGYEIHVVDTVFAFDDLDDARRLLGFYFGDAGRRGARRELTYRVAVFTWRR